MSRLEELVNELCPDGVEYRLIGEIADVGTGSSNGNEAEDEGLYPFFIRSQTIKRKNTFEYDEEAIIIPGEGSIGDIYHYINGKYALHQRVYRIHFHSDTIDTKFAYYCFSNNFKSFIIQKAVDATVKSIRKPMIEQFEVPVPPLKVQREIVRILDKFTQLNAELSAELSARRIQYEHYKGMLLDFSKDERIKCVALNDVCTIYDGTHQTPKYTNSGIQFVSVENIDDLYSSKKYISVDDYEKYKIKPIIGDVFMTRITAGVIGRCTVVEHDIPLAYYVSLALLRPDRKQLNSRYLKYYIESYHGRRELNKYILWDAAPTKINKDDIGKLKIYVPSLEEQERIVRLLDRFDDLSNNINTGIPLEIIKRNYQYEFYRDKLLTFKRKEAV